MDLEIGKTTVTATTFQDGETVTDTIVAYVTNWVVNPMENKFYIDVKLRGENREDISFGKTEVALTTSLFYDQQNNSYFQSVANKCINKINQITPYGLTFDAFTIEAP